MKITVETLVKAELNSVWGAWNNPEDIKRWNAASDDWHTTRSSIDLRAGGRVLVSETFDAKTENAPELQREGWQAILDKFAKHVEGETQ